MSRSIPRPKPRPLPSPPAGGHSAGAAQRDSILPPTLIAEVNRQILEQGKWWPRLRGLAAVYHMGSLSGAARLFGHKWGQRVKEPIRTLERDLGEFVGEECLTLIGTELGGVVLTPEGKALAKHVYPTFEAQLRLLEKLREAQAPRRRKR